MIESLGRRVPAPLKIAFEELNSENEDTFKREYYSLSESDDDAIGQWLKSAKARGDTKNSDSILLHLVIELHRKVDDLSKILNGEKREFIELRGEELVKEIGHGHFITKEDIFEVGHKYYARVDMPVFPARMMPLFIEAFSEDTARVLMMHDRDQKDWDSYITARERAIIRESKGLE